MRSASYCAAKVVRLEFNVPAAVTPATRPNCASSGAEIVPPMVIVVVPCASSKICPEPESSAFTVSEGVVLTALKICATVVAAPTVV